MVNKAVGKSKATKTTTTTTDKITKYKKSVPIPILAEDRITKVRMISQISKLNNAELKRIIGENENMYPITKKGMISVLKSIKSERVYKIYTEAIQALNEKRSSE